MTALRIACLVLALCASACAKRADSSAKGPRIVSLSPSTTEAVFAVGAGPELVGRSRFCDYPPEVAKLPQVGGFIDPSFEIILGLRPSLVVGARGPGGSAIADKLAARGVATYFPPTETFAEIDDMILGVGERTARTDAARAVVAKLHADIASVEQSVAAFPKTRVLVVFGLEPLSVAGPSSFADEMVRRAGGTNVVTAGGAYPTINFERTIALDPDVVINAAMMEDHADERLRKGAPGWERVRAVKEGHVARLTNEAVLRPGPRIAEGLRAFAQALHPALDGGGAQ